MLGLALSTACSSNDEINDLIDDKKTGQTNEPNDNGNGQTGTNEVLEISIKLPDDSTLDLNDMEIFSMGTQKTVEAALAKDIPYTPGHLELCYLMDQQQNLILAGFISKDTRELSVQSTAQVLLYFATFASLNPTSDKAGFTKYIQTEEAFTSLVGQLESMFGQNHLVFSQGGYEEVLNNTIASLISKETIDIEYKVEVGGIGQSGLAINDVGEKKFKVENNYPRRTHAFVYRKSFKDGFGNETIIYPEITASLTADRELDIPTPKIDHSDSGSVQDDKNIVLCSQGARYLATSSEALELEVAEGNSSETYEVSIIGPGFDTNKVREFTNKEKAKFENLSIETFVHDFFLPILTEITGNKSLYNNITAQQLDEMTQVVKPIVMAHTPTIDAVLANDFEKAIIEFFPFLYGDIRLSNDLREILKNIYSILRNGDSPNTFIQSNELIQEGESRYMAVTKSIFKFMEESSSIICMNQRLTASQKLVSWDITVQEGKVKLKPEELTVTPFADAEEIKAITFIDLEEGQNLEYEWTTTGQFGGVLYDYVGDNSGPSFTTSSDYVLFISNASTDQLGEGDNLETVSVKVFLTDDTSRTEIGSAEMTVNVKKKKFVIKPNGATITGDQSLRLYLDHNDGETKIPDNETDYKIVWSTEGNFGLFNGQHTTITHQNDPQIQYVADDEEVEHGIETIEAKIYARPKGSTDAFRFLDQLRATINIKNDPNCDISFKSYQTDFYLVPQSGNNPNCLNAKVGGVYVFVDKDPNVTKYTLEFTEKYSGYYNRYESQPTISWTNEQFDANHITEINGQFRVWAGNYNSACENTYTAEMAAALESITGFATLTTCAEQ